MRAFRILGPFDGRVQDVPAPTASAGQAVVEVARAGLCGTDAELYSGRLRERIGPELIRVPLTIGHEWAGRVISVGAPHDEHWVGRRVTGSTFIGCGDCDQCRIGRPSSCPTRFEIGVRGGWDGAVAEQLLVPVANLLPLPDSVSDAAGAMVEPASNVVRAFAELRRPVESVLVWGAGSLGLIAGRCATALGLRAVLVDPDAGAIDRARSLGMTACTPRDIAEHGSFDGAINVSPGDDVERRTTDHIRDGSAIVTVGFAAGSSSIDARVLAEHELRVIGVLGGVDFLSETIDLIAAGKLYVDDLVGEPITLDDVSAGLAGSRRSAAAKVQVG